MSIEHIWYPEAGDYSQWIERKRINLAKQGYVIMNEKEGHTFTGGEWVLFEVETKETL